MAWIPGVQRMELQPESDQQPAIRPTQFIVHSIAAPWTVGRIYEYWRDSTNLESHLGVGYDGSCAQFIGTETRADANAGANRRPDGTGAVSAETASNLDHSDPWTDAQVARLISIGAELHRMHNIPLRLCRTHDDPGYGWHGMFPEWSLGGTACPGVARIKQYRERVFPGIVARASGQQEEDDMPYTPEQIGSAVANAELPVYDQAGAVVGQAKLYEYLGGFKLANDRHDKALTDLTAAVQALTVAVAKLQGVTPEALTAAVKAGMRDGLSIKVTAGGGS